MLISNEINSFCHIDKNGELPLEIHQKHHDRKFFLVKQD